MNCGTCSSEVTQFLDLGLSPIADAYTATADEVSPRFPLRVGACDKCQLVQLMDDVDPGFNMGYSFYSSASAPLVAYNKAIADGIRGRYPDLTSQGVVEVGCNDGDLLRHFPNGLGVDPGGPAERARDNGLDVLVQPFGLDAAQEIRGQRGRQGIVLANHVLAHVADLGDVLAGIHLLLEDDGVAIVEVQYLPDLLVNNAFDLIYHEHRRFFSLTTLETAAREHGLYVVDAELTDRQGGSLRVTLARMYQAMAPATTRAQEIRASEAWLGSGLEGIQGRADRIRARLQDLVADQPGITAIYGAPAKATTLLNFCGFTCDDMPWCVDTTPAKQGRFIPGTGIPIVAPGTADADTFMIAAHNYAGHIIGHNPGKRWIIPIPSPMVI